MRVQGAVIREQGVTFAIVVVKPHVVQSHAEATAAIRSFVPVFRVPVVLMAQGSGGRPTYFGRQDLARFLSGVPFHSIPWKEYTIQ